MFPGDACLICSVHIQNIASVLPAGMLYRASSAVVRQNLCKIAVHIIPEVLVRYSLDFLVDELVAIVSINLEPLEWSNLHKTGDDILIVPRVSISAFGSSLGRIVDGPSVISGPVPSRIINRIVVRDIDVPGTVITEGYILVYQGHSGIDTYLKPLVDIECQLIVVRNPFIDIRIEFLITLSGIISHGRIVLESVTASGHIDIVLLGGRHLLVQDIHPLGVGKIAIYAIRVR